MANGAGVTKNGPARTAGRKKTVGHSQRAQQYNAAKPKLFQKFPEIGILHPHWDIESRLDLLKIEWLVEKFKELALPLREKFLQLVAEDENS